jgi:hypothetical protein
MPAGFFISVTVHQDYATTYKGGTPLSANRNTVEALAERAYNPISAT